MNKQSNIARLTRSDKLEAIAAPVRIVHLGLGAFHRAHQAWFTQHASDGALWGIAAFTGRKPDAAKALDAQDGLFTLIERGENIDKFELVTSIVEAYDGADVASLSRLVAAPSTSIITLTITEGAYNLTANGTLDTDKPAVIADIAVIAAGSADPVRRGEARWAATAPGRVVQALDARRKAGAGPVAVVSCDNLANNAVAARRAIGDLAAAANVELGLWINDNVSFVGTSVDRITPRTTEAEISLVESQCGYADLCPVVTEPFSDWVLEGEFPAGRPDWESAGAVFVECIEPFENRKLWLLNGAHSLLAYAGLLRGYHTVAEALADPVCAGWVEGFWDEAERSLPVNGLAITEYRQALLRRFGNARISHHLAQIATDGSSKLRMRAVPVYLLERARGRSGRGALRLIAAWVSFLRDAHGMGKDIADVQAAELQSALNRTAGEDLRALLAVLDGDLADDALVVAQLEAEIMDLEN